VDVDAFAAGFSAVADDVLLLEGVEFSAAVVAFVTAAATGVEVFDTATAGVLVDTAFADTADVIVATVWATAVTFGELEFAVALAGVEFTTTALFFVSLVTFEITEFFALFFDVSPVLALLVPGELAATESTCLVRVVSVLLEFSFGESATESVVLFVAGVGASTVLSTVNKPSAAIVMVAEPISVVPLAALILITELPSPPLTACDTGERILVRIVVVVLAMAICSMTF
jgi:hypothetical protein